MKKYSLEIDGQKFEVEVDLKTPQIADVKVNNKNYKIKIDENSSNAVDEKPKVIVNNELKEKKIEKNEVNQSFQGNPGDLLALMPGKILKVLVSEGQVIKMGEPVIIMESMKMEQTIVSSSDGSIQSIKVSEGETIEVGSVMLVIR